MAGRSRRCYELMPPVRWACHAVRVKLDLGRSRSGVPDLGGTTLLVVRHAECLGQVDDQLEGVDAFDSRLTPLGISQVLATVDAVARMEPDAVVCSHL